MSWPAIIGAAGSALAGGLSALSGGDAADAARSQQRMLMRIGQTAFSPINVFGPGGSTVSFGGPRPAIMPAVVPPSGAGPVPPGVPGQFGGYRPPIIPGDSVGVTGPALSTVPGGLSPGDIRRAGQLEEIAPGIRKVGRFAQSDIGQMNIGLGALDPAFQGLTGLATGLIGQAGMQGLPSYLQQAAFQNMMGTGAQSQQDLAAMLQQAGGAFGGAAQGLAQAQASPFLTGLAQQLGQQGGAAFGALPGTQEAARAETLRLMREQAAPFEERALAGLQERQFATGQLGTTGGGLQTEAFARGLGQADLQRQLAAGAEGRAAQQAQLGLAQGTMGAGMGLRGFQDELLTGAQGRFTGLANLASQMGLQRFGIGQELAQQALLPQIQAAGLQGATLQNALAALGGIGGLQAGGINQAQLALQAMQAQANARLGGATAAAGIQIPQSNTPTALAQLSQALAPQGGALPALGRGLQTLFGGGGGSPDLSTVGGIAPGLSQLGGGGGG